MGTASRLVHPRATLHPQYPADPAVRIRWTESTTGDVQAGTRKCPSWLRVRCSPPGSAGPRCGGGDSLQFRLRPLPRQ